MKSTFYSAFWRAALLGSQQVLALPVSDYMIIEQLEGHGLVGIGVLMQTSGDDLNLERGRRPSAHTIDISEAGVTPIRQLQGV
jgi:hypothetical protein